MENMNENNGILDPVNHELTLNELGGTNFVSFLDKLTDVPSSIPLNPITVDRAGIENQTAYVKIKSLFTDDYVDVFCNISMQVELVGHRGIHMSRCEEALFVLINSKFESLNEFANKLTKKLIELQKSEKAYVVVEGQYSAERKTKVTKRNSYDRLTLYVDCVATPKTTKTRIGVKAFNMTGCPCTETYTKFSVVPKLKEAGYKLEQIKEILNITNSGTHTQRGITSLILDKSSPTITHRAIYDVLDKSCHLVYELLKRPDEHELVIRALKRPQFTEDVVRDTVLNTLLDLGKYLKPTDRVTATSQLFDSIHIHDVCTQIDQTVAELKNQV